MLPHQRRWLAQKLWSEAVLVGLTGRVRLVADRRSHVHDGSVAKLVPLAVLHRDAHAVHHQGVRLGVAFCIRTAAVIPFGMRGKIDTAFTYTVNHAVYVPIDASVRQTQACAGNRGSSKLIMPGQQTPIHAIERVEQFLLSLCLQFVAFPLRFKLVERIIVFAASTPCTLRDLSHSRIKQNVCIRGQSRFRY